MLLNYEDLNLKPQYPRKPKLGMAMGPPGTPALAETGGFQEFIGWPVTEQKQ